MYTYKSLIYTNTCKYIRKYYVYVQSHIYTKICKCLRLYTYWHTHTHIYVYIWIHTRRTNLSLDMGWLRLVGSLKWYVCFAKEPYKTDDILQKRPIIIRTLLIVATPYEAQLRVAKEDEQESLCVSSVIRVYDIPYSSYSGDPLLWGGYD